MPEEKGKYLYCIIKTPEERQDSYGTRKNPEKLRLRAKHRFEFGIRGIEGKEVYTISEDKFSAVVSDSEIKEYLITRENLLTHQKVIEDIFKKYDVLPIRFGTVAMNSNEIAQKILKAKAKEFKDQLKQIEGKIELGLKASWADMKSIFEEIAKTSPTIQRLKNSKNISYQERISAGELVGEILEGKRETEKEKILEPLKKIADDLNENKVFGEDMILNAAFLVRKQKEKEFDRAVNGFHEKFGQRIKFRYIGPLPPFNFTTLKI